MPAAILPSPELDGVIAEQQVHFPVKGHWHGHIGKEGS